MERNPDFELKCYQRSFLYFARHLESKELVYEKLFRGLDDSVLNFIGSNTTLHKLKKRDTVYLEKGGFLVKGAIYYKRMKGEEVVSRIR